MHGVAKGSEFLANIIKMTNVTKTFLPPMAEYQQYLQQIWNSNQVANAGELWHDLQVRLQTYLSSPAPIPTANGTLPLQIALKVLAGKGEVITSPFSYVATAAAIVWQQCRPVFVDIHPEYLTIDEEKIEAAITEKTTAILATHVFGNPCNVDRIEEIAAKYDLKVIYDAAHCFGVKYKGKSIFTYGDVSTCSFHATKIFHTGEGGALFAQDPEIFKQLFYSHNFGHRGESDFHGLGINGKMSELQAAMGLAVLPYVDKIIFSKKEVVQLYQKLLDFSKISVLKIREHTTWNYSYFPVILESEEVLKNSVDLLKAENFFPRRYFYPSLNTISYMQQEGMKVSENIAGRILCLPLSHDIKEEEVARICEIINISA